MLSIPATTANLLFAQSFDDRRRDYATREEARWDRIEQRESLEQEKIDRMRENGMKAKRNAPSVPYNPITLGYHESKDGMDLKYNYFKCTSFASNVCAISGLKTIM